MAIKLFEYGLVFKCHLKFELSQDMMVLGVNTRLLTRRSAVRISAGPIFSTLKMEKPQIISYFRMKDDAEDIESSRIGSR